VRNTARNIAEKGGNRCRDVIWGGGPGGHLPPTEFLFFSYFFIIAVIKDGAVKEVNYRPIEE